MLRKKRRAKRESNTKVKEINKILKYTATITIYIYTVTIATMYFTHF